jgi:regulatory protein SWI5
METPHDPAAKQEARPNRFSDDYDESMEETIKPNRRPNQRTQNVFEEMRRQAEAQAAVPTPPRSNTMPNLMGMGSDGFMDMNNFNTEFMKIQGGYGGMGGLTSNMSSQQTVTGPTSLDAFEGLPDLRPHDLTSMPPSPTRSSCRNSPHRRTDSLASLASAASIADINIDETKTETGVTMDDITAYIQGPDPADNKWLCLYEGCGKRFGRKENIKSHVQTHLNDRQYQCPSCQKCFVRQHDLKRHAKIHTGIKPYPCECGNSFARHDALTRHRQRGMCIGAFDGIVRKVVKRGRPRKNRPDMETRVEKANRTRKKNMSISSISSQSECSDSSGPNSPQNDFDMLNSDFDLMDVAMDNDTLGGGGMLPVSSAAMPPALAALTTDLPGLQDYANSPESTHDHESQHSYVSPEAIMEPPPNLPPHPVSPAKSVISQINEPPELSQSSSPPPCRMFDVEPNTSGTDETSLSAFVPITTAGAPNLSGTLTVGHQDDEMLLKSFTNEDRLLQMERDSNMFLMSKFVEDYGVSMLENDSDMFFGTN